MNEDSGGFARVSKYCLKLGLFTSLVTKNAPTDAHSGIPGTTIRKYV